MRYATVCSGIEACTVAWEPLGFKPVFFSEIAPFPSRVLNHHYPNTPNLGDMSKIDGTKYNGSVDLICGGTPCQSFSVAGLRKGLADPRGNLALVFLRLVDQIRPRWILWENVPGVLSSNKGRDFGSFLGALAELGYGFGYRVLDAQFAGVPQRRRRVFVVGHSGDWRRAAAVLFEPEGVRGNFTPGTKAGQAVAALTASGVGMCGADDNQAQAGHLVMSTGQANAEIVQGCRPALTCNHEAPIVFNYRAGAGAGMSTNGINPTLDTSKTPAVWPAKTCSTLDAHFGKKQGLDPQSIHCQGAATLVPGDSQIRRLTPVECERLQGFPDDYTGIPKAADGSRYEAIGNSMAVPVMHWIGKRIQMVNQI